MKTLYHPTRLELLVHCAFYAGQPITVGGEGLDKAHVRRELNILIELGAVAPTYGKYSEQGHEVYATTRLGQAWVCALLDTACPRPAYVDEHDQPLIVPRQDTNEVHDDE